MLKFISFFVIFKVSISLLTKHADLQRKALSSERIKENNHSPTLKAINFGLPQGFDNSCSIMHLKSLITQQLKFLSCSVISSPIRGNLLNCRI